MVHKIIKTRFGVFFEAIILTFFILIIGVALGFGIEAYRTDKIIEQYKNYEIQAFDLKLQNYYYQIMDESSCKQAIEQNFVFADDLYNTGLELEKFEEANQITNDISLEKKRYVLLKTELWLNSILLKKKCNEPFDTVVYFYSDDPPSNIEVAEQRVLSNVLKTVKEDKGNKIILLPIAGDLKKGLDEEGIQLGAVDLQRKVYNITQLPSILINEEVVLEGYQTAEEIESHLNN